MKPVAIVTCKLPPDLDAALEAVASRRHISKSDVIREALVMTLKKQKRRVKLTAYDLARNLCGSLDAPSASPNRPRKEATE
jgi:Arc/MetJ-type ribon-helix-helix transcriptional regulator